MNEAVRAGALEGSEPAGPGESVDELWPLPGSRAYSDEQRAWLAAIRDHLGVDVEVARADLMEAPEFTARGGLVKARALFGPRLPDLLGELTDALVA